MQITKKFDQIIMPVSEVFQAGEIVVNNFLPWTGKVVSVNDAAQEVSFIQATPEEEQKRFDEVFAHLDRREDA
jgi:hypothetical protein